jgi:VCBS repeat protein
MPRPVSIIAFHFLLASVALAQEVFDRSRPWQRHSIDDSSRGADGVRLADVNGDGHLDIATGWEEAGLVRLYLNPGPAKAKERWPAVAVGKVKSPEDAVAVDLDGDGNFDVVSCCEGATKSVFVHWGPRKRETPARESSAIPLNLDAWVTEPFPALAGRRLAMFCLPMQIDGENGIDLVIGSKGKDADVGWLRSPENPRNLSAWTWHSLTKAGWIMSLVARDMDGDGDEDVLVSDRKGANRGVYWLERPEPKDVIGKWSRHDLKGIEGEVMFLDVAGTLRVPLRADGTRSVPTTEIIVPTHDHRLWLARGEDTSNDKWNLSELAWPKGIGNGKSAAFADIDLDGRRDIVISCETREQVSGIVWLSGPLSTRGASALREISGIAGPKGLKFDRVELIDLDRDGDQDVLTTEERTGWGVVWFENPTK